jgi:hypothetical protein
MSDIFSLGDMNQFTEKINLDDLYEKKRNSDLNKLEIFNRILNRIHTRIKTISRQTTQDYFCWYLVPEIVIGLPYYDQGVCIAYIIDKLKINGFLVSYVHPNLLFISWKHWIPTYIRTEIKKKTGVSVDGYGNVVADKPLTLTNQKSMDPFQNKDTKVIKKDDKQYKPIDSYKPTGNLVYSNDLLEKITNKFK